MSESNIVSKTMEALGALYPSWYKASQDQSVRYAWGRAMHHADLTMEQIKAGVLRAEQDESTFPPSCGQFIEWCKGAEKTPKHIAWQMAAMSASHKITDPLVHEAVRRTGSYDVKNGDESKIRPLFFEHYEQVCRESAEGQRFALPAPEPEPEQKQKTTDPEAGREALKGMYAMLDESIGGEHDAER